MTTVPTIPGPQASRVNKDSASDWIWYQYELGINSAVKSSVPNTTKVIAGAGLVGGGALSSDVTLALAATTVTAGAYGSPTKAVSFTVNQYGQLTAAAETVIDLSGLGGVPQTRLISTTAPLTGGGDLSSDRTLAITGSALTKTDDTNVMLALGGTPASALLAAVSLTLGWTGTLAVARGGTGVSTVPAAGAMLVGNAGATAYGSVAMSGDATLASTGAITVTKINGTDLTTAWSQTTPAPTSSSGSFTSVSAVVRYKQVGKSVTFQVQVPIVTNGTAGGFVIVTLPVPSKVGIDYSFGGRENASTGWALSCNVASGGLSIIISKYDGTYPGADGFTLNVGGTYEAA